MEEKKKESTRFLLQCKSDVAAGNCASSRAERERERLKTIEKACTYTNRTSTKETVLHFILLILLTQPHGKKKKTRENPK